MRFILEISHDLIEETMMGDEFPVVAAEQVLTGWLNNSSNWLDKKIRIVKVDAPPSEAEMIKAIKEFQTSNQTARNE